MCLRPSAGGRTRRSRSCRRDGSRRCGDRGPGARDEPGTKWTRSPPRSAWGVAVAVVQPERRRARRDRPLHDVAREEDPVAGGVEGQAGLDQPLAHPGPRISIPISARMRMRLVDDPADELVARGRSGSAAPTLLQVADAPVPRSAVRRILKLANSNASCVPPDAPARAAGRRRELLVATGTAIV